MREPKSIRCRYIYNICIVIVSIIIVKTNYALWL